MDRWLTKVSVVTGASSGVGARIAIDLANAGVKVVALARRMDRLNELVSSIHPQFQGNFYAKRCDVTSEESVKELFHWIDQTLGGVDILINNAGCIRPGNLLDADNSASLHAVIDTNVWGTLHCIRESFHQMKRHEVDGHIVIINSVLGHSVPYFKDRPSFNIYPSSKYALTAMTEVIRQELQTFETKIKITVMNTKKISSSRRDIKKISNVLQSISPGAIRTEAFTEEQIRIMESRNNPFLETEDISNAVLYALSTPPHVQVNRLILSI